MYATLLLNLRFLGYMSDIARVWHLMFENHNPHLAQLRNLLYKYFEDFKNNPLGGGECIDERIAKQYSFLIVFIYLV